MLTLGYPWRSINKLYARCAHTFSAVGLVETSSIMKDTPYNNIAPSIALKIGTDLHRQESHPLGIIKKKIENYFNIERVNMGDPIFTSFDQLNPIVSTQACFNDLCIPEDHVSRRLSDTYYIDENTVLRTHTSAHQCELLRQGHREFLVSGEVYRRDEIDASHYPVFHQMEGVRCFPKETTEKEIEMNLKESLAGMVRTIFGDVKMRWVDAYFPFTTPSFELEIFFQNKWMEVLGSGVIHPQVIRNAGLCDIGGWAFGLGLERLAMVLFNIPDIRLFWSKDPRFLSQFKKDQITEFRSFSKYPPCYKDISFWNDSTFHENDLFQLVRDVAGDIVEKVELIDQFIHPKTQRQSRCYRISYRHMERNLINEEIDKLQFALRDLIVSKLKVELR